MEHQCPVAECRVVSPNRHEDHQESSIVGDPVACYSPNPQSRLSLNEQIYTTENSIIKHGAFEANMTNTHVHLAGTKSYMGRNLLRVN